MADLLPSIPDTSVPEHAEPRVVGLQDEDAEDVLGALSSTTARELFAAVNEDPGHPSALADRIDTTLQNCQYHLGNLEDAGLVEVVDTAYSAKGREMDVYAPADQPLVVFAGDEHDRSLLSRALGRLLGGLGVLAAASVVAQGLFAGRESGDGAVGFGDALRSLSPTGGGDGGDAGGDEYEGGGAPPADDTDGGDATTSDTGGETTTGDTSGDTTGGAGTDDTGGETASDGATEATDGGDGDVSAYESPDGGDGGAGNATDGGADAVVDAVSPVADALDPVGDLLAATGLEPGLAVFAVGALALTLGVAVWYRTQLPPGAE